MKKNLCDFETQSEFDLRKGGAYEYSMHPSTRVMCFAFKVSNSKSIHFLDFHQMQMKFRQLPIYVQDAWWRYLRENDLAFVAHNAMFEQCIYMNILVKKLGWPEIRISRWRCSAAKAAASAIPRNLGDAGAVMRTPVQKDFEGHRVMMKLCKPTPAWNKWKKANDEIKMGLNVGPRKRKTAAEAEPLKFFTPETNPEDFLALYKYCRIDIYSEEKLDESLPDLTPREQNLWFYDQRINLRGVQIDRPLVDKISVIMAREQKTMTKELDILTMGLVASGNARNAILDFLTIEGIELPDLKAKTVDDFLKNGDMTGDAKKVLEIRRALSKASTAKYKMFKLRAGTDGRVRDLYMYCGAARTGRWSGKGLQPHNFPRGVIKDIYSAIDHIKTLDVPTLKLLYGENLMPLFSSVLRGMFVATEGHEMFVQDYSAIECRVAWWLAGHEAGLQMFRDGQDPYWEMAKAIFGLTFFTFYNSDNPLHVDMRQVGKAAVLGCGFGMGGKKFVTSAWDVYRAKVDLKMAKVAVATYRKVHYPVVEIWAEYSSAALAATKNPGEVYQVGRVKFFRHGRFLYIELPSGRKLSYCDPEAKWGTTWIMEKDGDVCYASNEIMIRHAQKYGYSKTGEFSTEHLAYWEVNNMAKRADTIIPKWALEHTYGGKIFENVVQAVSRDILSEALVRVEKKGFMVVMHSHDELVSEAPKGKFSSDEYKKVMEHLPTWADGLPLKSGGWVDVRYRKG